MNSIADGSVIIQTSCQSVPSTPPWFGEVALLVQYLRKHDILSTIAERVRCAPSFFLICWLVLWCQRTSQQDCGIAQEASGRSLISMGRVRPPANEPYLRPQSFLHQSAAYVRCVPRVTLDASEGKSSALVPPFCRLTRTSGSARSVGQAMASPERNYAEPWPRSSDISRPIRSQQSARS